MAEWFQHQAASGSLVLAIPVALVAGLVSFFSPCVIPLLPGYLSYATGLSGADLEHARRGRMLAGAAAVRARLHRRLRPDRHGLRRRSAAGWWSGADSSRWCSASSRSCSGWRSWAWCRSSSATSGSTRCRPSGSLPRRCSASCSGSAGPRASAPPCRRSPTLSLNEATAGRGALLVGGLLHRARAAVHRRRAGLPARPRGVRLRPPTPAVGDPRRRRDAGAGRPGPGHRLVGPGRHLAADPPGQRRRDGERCDAAERAGPSRPRTTRDLEPSGDRDDGRRSGELTARELLRWAWRQLTSMRTALVLLLLLALGAIPGSVIPQTGVDALKTQDWQAAHPHLTPIYERLGLFGVYHSPWFAAIYLLLMVSLVGCIVPAPVRLLARLPQAAAARPAQPDPPARPRVVHHRRGAGAVLDACRPPLHRVVTGSPLGSSADGGWVAAERGQLREAGNLLFHLVGAGRAGRLRDRQPVRLQGRRDPGRRQRLHQHPDPVRRLRARRAVRRRQDGAVPLHHRRLRRRLDRVGPRQGMARGFRGTADLPGCAGRERPRATTSGSTTR